MSTGLPSLYRRGIDIFGCKKAIPTRNSANSVLGQNLPPLLTINDLLLLGRDEIVQMKELKHSLRFVTTHKSRQQSVANNISTPPSLHPRKPHPPTAPSYLDDFLYDNEEGEEDNEDENSEPLVQNDTSDNFDPLYQADVNIDILTDDSLSSNGIPNSVETVDDAASSVAESTITDPVASVDMEIDPSIVSTNRTPSNEEDDDEYDDVVDLMFMANDHDETEDEISFGDEPPLDEFLSSLRMINLNIFNFHGTNHQNSESSSEVSTLLSSSEESNSNIFDNALTEQESDIKIDDALSFVSAICRGVQTFSKSPGAPIQSSQSPNSSSESTTPRLTGLSSSPSRSSNISTQNSSRRDSTLQEEGSSQSRSRSRSNTNDQNSSNEVNNYQVLTQHDINRIRSTSSRISPQISVPSPQETTISTQIHSPTTASPSGRRRRQIEIANPA